MGSCFSAESPIGSGTNSKYGSKEGNGLSGSSSRVSSVPQRTEGEILQSSNLKSFSFHELKTATRNFRPDSVLGEGGFGCVFKGWIDERTFAPARPGTGLVIAVKRLNQDGLQGHQEWLVKTSLPEFQMQWHPLMQIIIPVNDAKKFVGIFFIDLTIEIKHLGQLYHPNLVKLIGYGLEDDHRLLVYEFMPKGSLDNHLFRRGSYIQPLSWNLRMKIALGAAKGLAFLHSDEAKVIYRDFKTSNILLDSNYNAKLSDFGLAKDGPTGSQSHISTRVMGTHGYAAPEYMATGHLTAKSDVYSFGVVLLEMLSGRRAIDNNRPSREQNLVEWAKPYLQSKRKFFQVIDVRIEGQYSPGGALKTATLAIKCLSNEARFRPNMDEVVKALEQLQDCNDTRSSRNEPLQNFDHSSPRYQRKNLTENGNGRAAVYHRPSASPLRT